MFWSKLSKSTWHCAWKLAFPVFLSPIVWNVCENLHYESVYFKELHNEQEYYWPTTYTERGAAVVSTIASSGALAREARSGAPWVKKCGKLPIREKLVITWPYTARPPDRPSAPQTYQCKIIQLTGIATQMQLKVLFGKKSHGRPDF